MFDELATPVLEVRELGPAVARLVDTKTPLPLRQLGARGAAPGLKPHEALAVVVLLSGGDDDVAAVAQGTLKDLPPALSAGALTPQCHPAVLDALVTHHARNAELMLKALHLPQIAPSSVARAASLASEQVAELIATNEERLLKYPAIIETLYMNRATRMSTADRILELAVRNKLELKGIPAFKEAAFAITQELIAEPQEEPTFDDLLFKEADELAEVLHVDPLVEDTHTLDEATGEEVVDDKFVPLYAKLGQMTISQKIRRAMVGTSAERLLLVRDTNKLVSGAAIKSPQIQENEVVRISSSRSTPDDVLRIIALDRDWMRSYQIKYNLVTNPRTPFAFVAKLIGHIREHDLKQLSKSKNVTGAVATAAKQQLLRKGK